MKTIKSDQKFCVESKRTLYDVNHVLSGLFLIDTVCPSWIINKYGTCIKGAGYLKWTNKDHNQ